MDPDVPYITRVASWYAKVYECSLDTIDDLVQEGICAWMTAARTYIQQQRKTPFLAYVRYAVRKKITKIARTIKDNRLRIVSYHD